MSVNLAKARDFVYQNGLLWERALYAYHFEDGPIDRLHQIWACYQNADGGFGHALEPDIRAPQSHPLALEFLLGVIDFHALPIGNLLAKAPSWVAANQAEDGSLINPPNLQDYPRAPWWKDGGQTIPDAITGLLLKLGLCPPTVAARTRAWVATNLTLDHIRAVDWLFMNYHAYHYFLNVADMPDVEQYRQAIVENIVRCALAAPPTQYAAIFSFAPHPASRFAEALPADTVQRALDYINDSQQDDGAWRDEHDLAQWYTYTTINNLLTLRRFGRLR